MNNYPLVSVIMPVYNGARYLEDSIRSVINQTYGHWELIIIDDGSTDNTEQIVRRNKDPRIRFFSQTNKGVSSARNYGMDKMTGDYFCFLDADDVLPRKSLEARLNKFFENEKIDFVDGTVQVFDEPLKHRIRTYRPAFSGNPLPLLLKLSEKCFFGPSWMIRRRQHNYRMDESLSHGEDLFFYLTLCRYDGYYSFVADEILHYRRHDDSAMQNISGLYRGYKTIYQHLLPWPDFSIGTRIIFFCRMKKFIFLSFFHRRQYKEAIKALIS